MLGIDLTFLPACSTVQNIPWSAVHNPCFVHNFWTTRKLLFIKVKYCRACFWSCHTREYFLLVNCEQLLHQLFEYFFIFKCSYNKLPSRSTQIRSIWTILRTFTLRSLFINYFNPPWRVPVTFIKLCLSLCNDFFT